MAGGAVMFVLGAVLIFSLGELVKPAFGLPLTLTGLLPPALLTLLFVALAVLHLKRLSWGPHSPRPTLVAHRRRFPERRPEMIVETPAEQLDEVRIERIGPMDVTVLVTDRGSVPMNIGAVLQFDTADGPSYATVRALLSERVPTIPRLRQRLQRVPFGCGRPVWVDDPDFVLDRHLIERDWPGPAPGGDKQLLEVAAELLCQRLEIDRPLWLACLLTEAAGGRAGLILVLHHVLADGLGGLAILAALADPGLTVPARTFPQAPPQLRDLVVDAAHEKICAALGLPIRLRRGAAGLRELGLAQARPRLAEKTSLNRPTSNRRRLEVVTVSLADVVHVAHRAGGTVNDVVLTAVTGALLATLRARGEHPAQLVVSVPCRDGTPQVRSDSEMTPESGPSSCPHSQMTMLDSPKSSASQR
jgi:diacylglycerol O-acyltransferase